MKQLRRPPKYCQGFEDRHGKVRWYYRRPGYPRAALPGLPWSPDFMAAYELAAQGERMEVGRAKSKPGTIGALVASYYRTSDFTNQSDVTKRTYRNILERFRAEHADKRVAMLQRVHIQKLVNERAATLGVRKLKEKTGGFTTWENDHIDRFLAHHKPGSRAHLSLMLLLYTGQRRSDVVRMGRQHVRNNVLTIVQQKTGQQVSIPLHPDLKRALDSLPKDNLTFVVSDHGGPLKPESFTNWFHKMVRGAGLSGLSPHGLRKATCRMLAEAGCTRHQIMAISGHKTLSEVTRYTVAASRKGLAEGAMASLSQIKGGT